MPFRHVSWWIFLIYLIVAVAGMRKHFRLRLRFKFTSALFLAGLAIVGAVGLKSFHGCYPSVSNDAWAYASIGQYLADYPRFTERALPYIDRFAACLSNTRFGTPSLLGFVSAIFHISTAKALLPVLLIMLANGLLGFYLLTRLLGAGKVIALGSGIFCVLCGWTSDAIIIGNLDNLFFLSLSGAYVARLLLVVRGCRSWQALWAPGITLAALFYTYPEGLLLISVILAPFMVEVGFRALKIDHQLPLRLIVVLLATLALVVTYLPTWTTFFSQQLAAMNSLSRPGDGIFPGLLRSADISALLGLGRNFRLRQRRH